MQGVSNANFGPLIAYLVPGATVLVGASNFSTMLQSWFATASADAPSIGGFLYLTVASIAVGMTVSAVRWAILDTLHAVTGLPLPSLDFSRLGENVNAFGLLIEIHYRHYQFYSNMFVASAMAYACYRIEMTSPFSVGWPDLAFVLLELVFFATSRDTLRKYFVRSQQLLSAADLAAHGSVASKKPSVATKDATCVTEEHALAVPRSRPASRRASDTPSAVE
jgi:hypothetical protein